MDLLQQAGQGSTAHAGHLARWGNELLEMVAGGRAYGGDRSGPRHATPSSCISALVN
jgi:hypothetical protein